MSLKNYLLGGIALAMATTAAQPGHAQQLVSLTDRQVERLLHQIDQLEKQVRTLQNQVNGNEVRLKRTEKKADEGTPVRVDGVKARGAPPPPPGPRLKMSANNRPTFESADGMNSISLTSRLHFDFGQYGYRPHSALTVPQELFSGANARRARLGVLGTFMRDWDYALIFDLGGSSDGYPPVPGAPASGIQNAYITYNGFRPFAIEGGYMDTPFTLNQAMSSNDSLFMERPSSQAIASGQFAGDNRSAFGVRVNTDRFWAGAYVTGPTSGAAHNVQKQVGAFGRVTFQVVQEKDYTLHIGGNVGSLITPPLAGGVGSITLSDRPELRLDPTVIMTTGAIANVDHFDVLGFEAAASLYNFFIQGEYFNYTVARIGLPELNFEGGYVEAALTLTGEQHRYNPRTGAYGGIAPKNPFVHGGPGWGAWEIVGRWSFVDLNDLSVAPALRGGRQTVYAAGLNWYVNNNVRFMLNYLHGTVERQNAALVAIGADFDAVAMRAQVAF